MSNSAEQAEVLNNALADDAPEMPDALSGEVRLLRGLHDTSNDTWHTTAMVRELTGADEEHLAQFGAKEDLGYSEYMAEVLKRAVLTIGSLDVQRTPEFVSKLILPDRDLLFLGVVKRAYGRTKDFRVTCRKCQEKTDVEVDLDEDFPVTAPDFDITKPLSVETLHGEINLKLTTGEAAELAASEAKTDAEINTYMLASSVVDEKLDTMEERLAWARALGAGDRRKLISALSDIKIGPRMEEVETQCAYCDNPITVQLDWVSLLLA